MPGWIGSGFDDYVKRMPPDCRIALKEIKPQERTGGMRAEQAMQIERSRIEAVLPKAARIIALDERGSAPDSVELSRMLQKWREDGRDVVFIIGGADGLDPELKQRADQLLRLSSLTLPHGMVRVLLAEQLYRAWSITQNHPYHRV